MESQKVKISDKPSWCTALRDIMQPTRFLCLSLHFLTFTLCVLCFYLRHVLFQWLLCLIFLPYINRTANIFRDLGFRLTWPFRRDEEDSETPMAYAEIVYKTRSWRSNVTSRLSAQRAAMLMVTSLLKCPNYISQLQEASTHGYRIARGVMQKEFSVLWLLWETNFLVCGTIKETVSLA